MKVILIFLAFLVLYSLLSYGCAAQGRNPNPPSPPPRPSPNPPRPSPNPPSPPSMRRVRANLLPNPQVKRRLKVGSWNIGALGQNLDPIIQQMPRDLDVLAIQEAYLPHDIQYIVEQMSEDYPYHYSVPFDAGSKVGCSENGAALLQRFKQCVARNNITYIYYSTVIPCVDILKEWIRVDSDCSQCYLAGLVVHDPNTERNCLQNNGYKTLLFGSTGLMVLSKRPIENPMFEDSQVYLPRRGLLSFCVDGLYFMNSHFIFNWTYVDAQGNNGWVPVDGYLQPEMANEILIRRPQVVLADLNTGINYQPEGHNILTSEGYNSLTEHIATFCPDPTHPSCAYEFEEDTKLNIDHIMFDEEALHYHLMWVKTYNGKVGTFADSAQTQVSDHIGITAELSYIKTRDHPFCRRPSNSN